MNTYKLKTLRLSLAVLAVGGILPAQADTWDGSVATSFSVIDEGAQTISITTAAELALLAQNVKGGTSYYGWKITQAADIDLGGSAHPWTPIGTSTSKNFRGSYNGNGFTVSNLYVKSTGSYLGLFGYVDGYLLETSMRPKLQNIRIIGADVIGGRLIGALAGSTHTVTISNCYVEGTVTGNGHSSGGLVGITSFSDISDCCFIGSVTDGVTEYGSGKIGGIGGVIGAGSSIANSYVSSTITSINGYVGTVAGENYGQITNCYYDSTKGGKLKGIGTETVGVSEDYKTTALPDLSGTALTTQLGIAKWNYVTGKMPVQKLFDSSNTYDVTIRYGMGDIAPIAADVTNANVRLERSFSSGKYTVMLPFSLTAEQAEEWGTFYQYASYDEGSSTVAFDKVTAGVAANTPYVFRPKAAFSGKSFEGITLAATPGDMPDASAPTAAGLVGTYKSVTVAAGAYGYSGVSGAFVKTGEGVTLPAGTACLWLGTQSGVKSLRAVFAGEEGQVTAIGQVHNRATDAGAPSSFYNLDGHRLGAPQRGINIINGKKTIVK